MDIKIQKNTNSKINSVNWNDLRFGVYFSDHVFMADHNNGKWNDHRIVPYGPMEVEPTLCTLHYGQSIFEGLKAFRTKSGGVNVFRPEMNARRMNHSAERLCIPEFEEKDFLEAETVIELGREPMKIQILTGIDGVSFDRCHARRVTLTDAGLAIPFIALDDLIANKAAAPRAKDKIDLDELRRFRDLAP